MPKDNAYAPPYDFQESYRFSIEIDRRHVPGSLELTEEQWDHVCYLADKDATLIDEMALALSSGLAKRATKYAADAKATVTAEALKLIEGGLTGENATPVN